MEIFSSPTQRMGQSMIDSRKTQEGGYSDGKPVDPTWSNIFDPKTMSLTPEISTRLDGINTDKRGINQFRSEALRTGRSPWAMLAHKGQDLEQGKALDLGTRTAASQGAGARGQLAMRGGLTSGARERIAGNQANSVLDMTQNVAGQGAQNRLQIDMNDEQNRIGQLGQLPGMENLAIQPDLDKTKLYGQARQLDIGNTIGNNQSKNAFDMGLYGEKMKAWAAEKQAKAIDDSGKK